MGSCSQNCKPLLRINQHSSVKNKTMQQWDHVVSKVSPWCKPIGLSRLIPFPLYSLHSHSSTEQICLQHCTTNHNMAEHRLCGSEIFTIPDWFVGLLGKWFYLEVISHDNGVRGQAIDWGTFSGGQKTGTRVFEILYS